MSRGPLIQAKPRPYPPLSGIPEEDETELDPSDPENPANLTLEETLQKLEWLAVADKTPQTTSQQIGAQLQRKIFKTVIPMTVADLLSTVVEKTDDKASISSVAAVLFRKDGTAEIVHQRPVEAMGAPFHPMKPPRVVEEESILHYFHGVVPEEWFGVRSSKLDCARKTTVTQLCMSTDLCFADSLGGSRAPVHTMVRNFTAISFGGALAEELVCATQKIGRTYRWKTMTVLAGTNNFLKAPFQNGRRDIEHAAVQVCETCSSPT